MYSRLDPFKNYKFDRDVLKRLFETFDFKNGRPITKSMLAWWAFSFKEQEFLDIETKFDIEHIYAKNRLNVSNEDKFDDPLNIESLGNKSLLEKKINIRASDYRFKDKKKYYNGFKNSRNQIKLGTKIQDLLELSNKEDFIEKDIIERKKNIIDKFLNYLDNYKLLNN